MKTQFTLPSAYSTTPKERERERVNKAQEEQRSQDENKNKTSTAKKKKKTIQRGACNCIFAAVERLGLVFLLLPSPRTARTGAHLRSIDGSAATTASPGLNCLPRTPSRFNRLETRRSRAYCDSVGLFVRSFTSARWLFHLYYLPVFFSSSSFQREMRASQWTLFQEIQADHQFFQLKPKQTKND